MRGINIDKEANRKYMVSRLINGILIAWNCFYHLLMRILDAQQN
jgi:hypothetical protein